MEKYRGVSISQEGIERLLERLDDSRCSFCGNDDVGPLVGGSFQLGSVQIGGKWVEIRAKICADCKDIATRIFEDIAPSEPADTSNIIQFPHRP